jgi:nicotinamidase-related amidase
MQDRVATMPLTAHEDCLLIVVDAQPGFFPDDLPAEDRAGAARALERAAWLAALARALGVPVVVTEEEPERNGPTDARIAERLAPGTPVLTKPTFGLAGTPEILRAVAATGRPTAVLAGFETDVCVLQSAIGLLDAGLRVIAAEDATFSPGEMHERGLARLRDAGANLTHCKALAYQWVRTVARSTELLSSGVLGPAPFRL